MSGKLDFTGERFIPGVPGEIWLEHWHRYHFAARWAVGGRVLDVACGEGYGSAALARRAAHVTGVDVSDAAIAHARAAYADRANLEFLAASCTRLPLPDAAFDTVVSFETIEHIEGQEAFLDEVARVLKPGGVFVLSCPNKVEYSDKRDYRNEYHVKELYREELARIVAARFPQVAWYGQRPTFYSVIAPEAGALGPGLRRGDEAGARGDEAGARGDEAGAQGEEPRVQGELFEVEERDPSAATGTLAHPLYFLLVASRDAGAIAATPAAISVLADRDDWMYRDYGNVIRELRAAAARVADLEEQARAKDHEILRRGGLRWWLRLPLRRFGILK